MLRQTRGSGTLSRACYQTVAKPVVEASGRGKRRLAHLTRSYQIFPTRAASAGEHAEAREVLVRLTGGLASLGDGPDYERGAPLGVAGDKDAGFARAEAVVGRDSAPLVVAEAEVVEKAIAHGAGEADGEQDEVGLYGEVRAFYGDGVALGGTLGADGVHLLDVAVASREALYGDGESALAALLVGGVGVQDERPVGPGEVVRVLGGPGAVGEDLDRGATLAVGVAEAVGARVAAAKNHDVLAPRGDLWLLDRQTRDPPVLLHQVVHREVDAVKLAARHVEVSARQSADGEDDGVELHLELLGGRVVAGVGARAELDALFFHLGDPAFHDPLLYLVVGDAVAEEAPDLIVLLEDDDRVAGPVELLGSREARWTAADHRHPFAGAELGGRGLRGDPALLEGAVDDRELYLFYGDGRVVYGEHARCLARRGAQHPRELGEVVRRVQPVYGLPPVVPVDEVVPIGDKVPQRTARVAEGDAAVHAARGLALELLFGPRLVDVAVVLDALLDGALRGGLAPDLEEPLRVAH